MCKSLNNNISITQKLIERGSASIIFFVMYLIHFHANLRIGYNIRCDTRKSIGFGETSPADTCLYNKMWAIWMIGMVPEFDLPW